MTRLPHLRLTDHWFELPLDHTKPDGPKIRVYGREVVAASQADDELPWLVFLQGGPGFGAPRPMGRTGWIKRATEEYRVLLLDQRGTERSSRVDADTLSALGGVDATVDYLTHFRADAIVRDCEAIRRRLAGDQPWSVLGQSYGGFCATRYLSAAPEGLREVLIAGGLPPLHRHADDVYRRTYPRVMEKNRRYYDRYPGDVDVVRRILDHLESGHVELPGGGRLTPRRLLQLGLHFGFDDGYEIVHYLLEDAFLPGGGPAKLSYSFLRGFENALPYETNPIFSLLHEACYAQRFATRWSAQRLRCEFEAFDRDDPPLFTGEMIYPWMFDDMPRLAPLREVADQLAEKDDWPQLYDEVALRANTVPCAAAVYHDDMYVDHELSLETAATIGGIRLWITNEFEHNGLRSHGEAVLDRLLGKLRD